jgi:hypothetical protein
MSNKTLSKKQKAIIGITAFIVLVISWWAFVSFAPHPLGDKLEYIGKEDLGGGLLFRDTTSYSLYYYGTDMTPEQVAEYFKNGSILEKSNTTDYGSSLRIKAPNGETIDIDITPANVLQQNNPKAPRSDKKYILQIPSFKYDAAKSSL